MRVTTSGDATALAGIMRLVDEAQRVARTPRSSAIRAAAWLFYIALAVAVGGGLWTVCRCGPIAEVICRVRHGDGDRMSPRARSCHPAGRRHLTSVLPASPGILVRDRHALEEGAASTRSSSTRRGPSRGPSRVVRWRSPAARARGEGARSGRRRSRRTRSTPSPARRREVRSSTGRAVPPPVGAVRRPGGRGVRRAARDVGGIRWRVTPCSRWLGRRSRRAAPQRHDDGDDNAGRPTDAASSWCDGGGGGGLCPGRRQPTKATTRSGTCTT